MMDTANDEHILKTRLQKYCDSGIYPMHMPGHKRRLAPAEGLPYEWDVTEVPETDDLHAAGGILKEAMARTARLFGSRRTWYLVNGSTCGLLAAICACVPAGGEVIFARNCHKSVYHAAELRNLKVHWILPPILQGWGICGSIRPADVARLLEEHPSAKTVVLTSPTYEGVISDIASIARICHAHGARLIVDEAHGAHLGMYCAFPESALHLGADIVVQSAHKTLPSLTQTALLHLGQGETETGTERDEDVILERHIEHALDIFETSSPSYPLMASLDGCTGLLEERGEELFTAWRRQIRRTDEVIAGLPHLKVLRHGTPAGKDDIFAYDDSRFLLRAPEDCAVTGEKLSYILREEGRMEPEMHCADNVLLMSSCADTDEGWEIVRKALLRADQILSGYRGIRKQRGRIPEKTAAAPIETVLSPAEAHRRILVGEFRRIPLPEARGQISAEYVMAYPPGIPLLIPGERIASQTLRTIEYLTRSGSGMRYSLTGKTADIAVFLSAGQTGEP